MSETVVGTVTILEEKVLALFKRKTRRYEFPGGKIEPGETPREAAAREAREETGCTMRLGKMVGRYRFETHSGPKEILLFSAAPVGKPHVAEPAKFSELRYIPISSIKEHPVAPYIDMFCKEYLEGRIRVE